MKRRPPSMAKPKDHHHAGTTSNDGNNTNGARAKITGFVSRARESVQVTMNTIQQGNNSTGFFQDDSNGNNNNNNNNNGNGNGNNKVFLSTQSSVSNTSVDPEEHSDRFNYALLIVLYTLQGIPMGLSASIPFLLQEKIQKMAAAAASLGTAASAAATGSAHAVAAAEAARASYNANAIFALCSWPFSLKLLWAPIVDAIYFKRFGRRKSWLVPVQSLAGLIMIGGANFVERQLGLTTDNASEIATMNVRGVTTFFFVLYFLMATQDVAVDGWALTMLSKKNRGRGPICNSIGQNIGYFLSFVGFLALNDVESSESIWRPLFGLPSDPSKGLVSLKGFLRFMGGFMLVTTLIVALFKREIKPESNSYNNNNGGSILAKLNSKQSGSDLGDEDAELDASEIGLKETYHRLWAVCKLPSVRWLFLILVTYRLPTSLSDNVKFLKAVELGLSKSTTALLSPTLILPLGIVVPLVASKIWHMEPLRQFIRAYEWRVTLIPLLDIFMLRLLQSGYPHNTCLFWSAVVASTAGQAIVNSLQFNAQMTFFASRVDPAIGGSYMTLLNTAANLGGTWPASFVMGLLGLLSGSKYDGASSSSFAKDPYVGLQTVFSLLGVLWIFMFAPKLKLLANLPDDAWRTHLLDGSETGSSVNAMESGEMDLSRWTAAKNEGKIE
ncbi:acetyl-coa transporter [Nitzschia inconspicua]|uniref:Acetyl-coa transporter n=1 Tax=Nitzschia inconspicua TaxID=303405 RepID=A0A9K3PXX2_9STRA|nr:acetyl-coa transporter [Nitzschia inconspicua]